MISLKQEMREKFEKRSSMSFYDNNAKFEEGLLEKIINLALANLYPFSRERWKITAVRSPVRLQRLYSITGEKRVLDSAFTLIITGSTSGECSRRDLDLLSLSISYAAKFYCIDSHFAGQFDSGAVAREFPSDQGKPEALICLGYFRNTPDFVSVGLKNFYSETIRVI